MWPIVDSDSETKSYHKFGKDQFLTTPLMRWMYDLYIRGPEQRKSIYASPLQATIEQLENLPPALIQNAANDVIRDEGEAYGSKLDEAGVPVITVRYNGVIHGFGLLDGQASLPAVRSDLRQVAAALIKYLGIRFFFIFLTIFFMFKINAVHIIVVIIMALAALKPALAQPKNVKNIVLVHGAFADGSSWSRVIPLLEAKGYKVTAVQNPLTSLDDDVNATKRIIALQDGPVLLVGHSWGGVVISQAGNDPKVAGLVFVAAYAPDNGESLSDVAKTAASPPGNEQVKKDASGFLSQTPKGIFENFAQDLPMADRKIILATQGQWAAFTTEEKVTVAAWHDKHAWYLIAGNDRMINPGLQRTMAKRMKAQTLELQSSHVPMLSQPAKVAAFLINAAQITASK